MSGKDNLSTTNQEFNMSNKTVDELKSQKQDATESTLQENTFAYQDTLKNLLQPISTRSYRRFLTS